MGGKIAEIKKVSREKVGKDGRVKTCEEERKENRDASADQ